MKKAKTKSAVADPVKPRKRAKREKAVAREVPLAVAQLRMQQYEEVGLAQLLPHPQNPNRGDAGAIEESVRTHGFYGAVIVQRSTGYILAGNHRLQAARAAGLEKVPVLWLDVDDNQALKILLVDNRTTRLGYDDPAQLYDLLKAMGDELQGTGYQLDDVQELHDALVASAPAELPDKSPFEEMTFTLHGSQAAMVRRAIDAALDTGKVSLKVNANKNGSALYYACKKFVEIQRKK